MANSPVHVRAVTEIEAKIRGIKRHPIAKTLTKSQPSDERWMIDGIGTDSPKLVKSAGRNGSASKLESWAEAINRVTAASLLDETRQKVRDTFAAFLGPALESHIPFAATYGNHDFQCGILADEQDDLYREFAGCMNPSPTRRRWRSNRARSRCRSKRPTVRGVSQ